MKTIETTLTTTAFYSEDGSRKYLIKNPGILLNLRSQLCCLRRAQPRESH